MYFSTTIEPSPTNKSFVIYVTLPGNVFPITEPLESQDNSINQDGYQSHFTIRKNFIFFIFFIFFFFFEIKVK